MPFRLVDHTADLAIEAEGPDMGTTLAEAARALTQVLAGKPCQDLGRPQREVTFTVDAPDLQALAVAFLSELLWLNESADLLWVGGGVEVAAPRHEIVPATAPILRATARGNAVIHDVARHGRGVEVKAATYHGVRFEKAATGWELRVLLDI